jgi:hypothetical protein
MAKDRNIPSVIFRKAGIFIRYGDGEEQRIGDPIRVLALGQGLQDKLAYTVLELQDRDKRWRKAVVRSSLLTARTTDFKEELTDVYNYRLPIRKYAALVIDELATKNPERRIHITAVPGWQGRRYAHPNFEKEPRRRFRRDELLTRNEAQRIAVIFSQLPELLGEPEA